MKYIQLDSDFKICGRFDSVIHEPHQIPSDAIEVSEELFTEILSEYAQDLKYIDGILTKHPKPEIIRNFSWDNIRKKRNALLSQSDWTQFPDASLSPLDKQNWKVYRQQLRDLPNNQSDPNSIIWPEIPK